MEELNKTIEDGVVKYQDTLSSNFVAWDLNPEGEMERFKEEEDLFDKEALQTIRNGRTK